MRASGEAFQPAWDEDAGSQRPTERKTCVESNARTLRTARGGRAKRLLERRVGPSEPLAMTERLAIIPHPVLWRGVADPLAGAPQHFDVSAVPEDLLLVVVGFLDDYRDVLRFGRVCKACQLVASNDTVWRSLYESRFPRPSHAPQRGWRDLYRCVPCAKLRTRFRGATPRPLSKNAHPLCVASTRRLGSCCSARRCKRSLTWHTRVTALPRECEGAESAATLVAPLLYAPVYDFSCI